jgi:hypothetical protein
VSESTDTTPHSGEADGPSVSFSSFVVSLATSAMTHLGHGPDGKVDLPIARQTIDLLGVLQEKTKGNLDDEERQLLETVLHETRTKYLEKA